MTKSEKRLLIILLGSVAAIGPFSIDMYLPSFPAIAESFGVTEAQISYTLTGYFIGISLGQLFYGPLLDRYGRKKPLLIGLSIYALTSLACSFAPGLYILIVLRFIQALGASVGMVAGMAIIRDQFGVTEVARMLSSVLLVMGVAPIVAPTLGGFLLVNFSWHAIFIFLSVIALILITNLHFFLKETQGFNPEVTLNIKKITLNYWHTLKNQNFTNFTLSGSLAMAIMFAYISSISYILMSIYKVSESTFGWLFGLNAFGFILGSQLNHYLLKIFRLYQLTRFINFLQVLLAVAFLVLYYTTEISLPLFCSLIFSILFMLGFLNPNSTALSLEHIKQNIGVASALNGSIRMVSGAVITFVMGKIADGTMQPLLWSILTLTLLSFFLLLKSRKFDFL